jgi:hypothetical protein
LVGATVRHTADSSRISDPPTAACTLDGIKVFR